MPRLRTTVACLVAGLLACFQPALAAVPTFTKAVPERIDLAIGDLFALELPTEDADGDEVLVTVDGMPGWMRSEHGLDLSRNVVETLAFPAEYASVWDMESDRDGNLYLSALHASGAGHILKIDARGTLTVLASGLRNVVHIAVTRDKTLYYAEESDIGETPSTKIYRLNANESATLVNAAIDRVYEMDADAAGNLIMLRVNATGTLTQVLKLVPADGVARILAGSIVAQTAVYPNLDQQLVRDGVGEAALLAYSTSLFVGRDDVMYVPDIAGRIRKVTAGGLVSTLPLATSSLTRELHVDALDNMYFMRDSGIQYVDHDDNVRTAAGTPTAQAAGAVDGRGTAARFRTIIASVMRADGNLVVADWQTQQEPFRPLLRTVKFHSYLLLGSPQPGDHGQFELTVKASDGTNTVSKTVLVNVENRFDLRDRVYSHFSVAPGMAVEGGTLEGRISGDATHPGTLRDLYIRAGSTLANVVIGSGVEFGRDIKLLQNVRFESNAYVPVGVLLDAALGYVPDSGSGSYPGVVDLNSSVLLDPVPLIDEIRAVSPALGKDGALALNERGQIIYTKDDIRMTFEPLRVESGDPYNPAYRSGIFFDATATRYIQTPSGRLIYLRPAAEDMIAIAIALYWKNLTIASDLSGVHMVLKGQSGFQPTMALLPDPLSMNARAGLAEGFHVLPNPAFPGYSYYLFVFNADGQLREQAFYPTALSPAFLNVILSFVAGGNVALLPFGGVELQYLGKRLRLMPSLTLKPSTVSRAGFAPAGDLNGDGLMDYSMVYPNPVFAEQVYYGLPQ